MTISKLAPGMALASLKGLFSDSEIDEMYIGKRTGTIDIEINDRCNFKCIYCYTSSDALGSPVEGERLTLKEKLNIIDQAADLDIRLLNLQGGEPLLYKDLFFTIADYARPKFKALVAFTNGSTLTEPDIRHIADLGMSLCVKLDTLSDKIAYEMTGRHSVVKNILPVLDLLKKYNVPVTTNSVATPLNYYGIPDVWRYVTKLGFTPFVARNHYHGRTRNNKSLQLSAVELKNLFKELERIDNEEFGIKWPASILWPRGNACQRYRAGVYVNCVGAVTPCSEADPEYFTLGNIRRHDLKTILSYDNMRQVRNIYDKLHGGCQTDKCEHAKNQVCYGCRVSAADVGVFRGKNFRTEFFGGDPLCYHNKINPLTNKEIGRKELKWTS